MKKTLPKINPNAIVAAYPVAYSGPGWSNVLVHVLYYKDGDLTEAHIQGRDMSVEAHTLTPVAMAAQRSFTEAVRAMFGRKHKP